MAGHSKWSKIKRKKAVTDVRRGRLNTKLLREVQIAAKMGGGNPDGNPRLKLAIQAARAMSVPSDNIDRAIKRGSGDVAGADYEEIIYEGYAPGGIALLIKACTDNKNRTVAEVRHILSKGGGTLGGSNSVAHLFDEKGIIAVPKPLIMEDKLLELALEAGALDVSDQDDVWEVVTEPRDFARVSQVLEKLGEGIDAQLQMIARTSVQVTGSEAESVLRLVDALEDLDDVQSVTANFEIDDEELKTISEE